MSSWSKETYCWAFLALTWRRVDHFQYSTVIIVAESATAVSNVVIRCLSSRTLPCQCHWLWNFVCALLIVFMSLELPWKEGFLSPWLSVSSSSRLLQTQKIGQVRSKYGLRRKRPKCFLDPSEGLLYILYQITHANSVRYIAVRQ